MSHLEDNKDWKLASAIAVSAYQILDELPEDEKWGMISKIRDRALGLSTAVAEAVGSIDPRDTHYCLGQAKRHVFGLKNVYHLASKSGIVRIEPEEMADLNQLSDILDKGIDKAAKEIPNYLQQYDGATKK